jgi:hypothetical protein
MTEDDENRVVRRIFAPKMDKVMGGQRKLHEEWLCDFVLFDKV